MDSHKFVKDAQLMASIRSLSALRNIGASNTGRFVKSLRDAGRKGGLKGILNEAARYNPPSVNVKRNIPGKANLPKMQMGEATLGRGIRSSIGVTADNLRTLTKGTGSGPLTQRAKNLVTNVKDTVTNQLRGSQFTEKELRNLKPGSVFTEGGKKFLRGRGLAPNREIVQETGRGVMVKKRLPMRMISPVTTSPGAVGATGATAIFESALEPDKSKTEIAKSSLGAGGRFLLGDAPGFASYLIAPPRN